MSALSRDRGIINKSISAMAIVFFFFIAMALPGISRGAITEGFDNFETGTRPVGWTFNGCNNDWDVYTSVGDYGNASPSIKLDLTDDYIETETFSAPPDELTFWVKGMGTDASSALLVEEYYSIPAPGGWNTLTNVMPLPLTGADLGPFEFDYTAVTARFTYAKSAGDLAFDDVEITDAMTPTSTPTPPPTPTPTAYVPTPVPTATPEATRTPVICTRLDEGFDGFNTGVRPPGWTFNGCDQDSDTYTSYGNFGIASPSIKLDGDGEYIETSSFLSGEWLKFWIKGQGVVGTSSLQVEEYYSGSGWNPLTDIASLPGTGTRYGPIDLDSYTSRLRFKYDRDSGELAFDDVMVKCRITPTPPPPTPPPPTPTPPPIICNNSFEEDPDLVCWDKVGTASSIEKSSAEHYHGSFSCLFEAPTTTYTGRGVRSTRIDCGAVTAGHSYDIDGYFFVYDENGGDVETTVFQFFIEWRDGNGDIIQTGGSDGWNLEEFDEWEQKRYGQEQAPAGAVSVTLYIAVKELDNTNNPVYIDYFNVIALPPPSPTPIGYKTPLPTPVPVEGSISGWVYDRETGQGIPSIYVRALPIDSGILPGGGLTNSAGYYSTNRLDAGVYKLYVNGSQGWGIRVYRDQWYYQVDPDNKNKASRVSSSSSGKDFPLYKVGVFPTPTPAPTPDFQPVRVVSGDYNGDGLSDIAIFRGASGLWAVRSVTRGYFGVDGDIPVSGDYDGDGIADIAIFRGASGLWAANGVTRVYFGGASDQPAPGDYDGDGLCDFGIFRNSTGLWAVSGVTRAYFGGSADQPVAGDYNGDGLTDIAIFRDSVGLWAVRGLNRIYFGIAADSALPGDYDGAGNWAPAIYRPSSGLWAVRGVTRVYFGGVAYQPVPADYDGNGRDEIGIFRPDWSLWAIREVTRDYFGITGDMPATR